MFWPWLIFIDFLLITLLSSASSFLFARALILLYRLSIEKHLRMAPSFIAFMGEMTLLSVALAVNGFIMLINWHRGWVPFIYSLKLIFLFRWLQQCGIGLLVRCPRWMFDSGCSHRCTFPLHWSANHFDEATFLWPMCEEDFGSFECIQCHFAHTHSFLFQFKPRNIRQREKWLKMRINIKYIYKNRMLDICLLQFGIFHFHLCNWPIPRGGAQFHCIHCPSRPFDQTKGSTNWHSKSKYLQFK